MPTSAREIIKIERPGEGDFARGYDSFVRGMSSFVIWLNRGKRSVTLDIKQPARAQILDRLVARGRRPGAEPGARRGRPPRAALRGAGAWQPRLMVCDISGYGDGGPFGDKKAYDLLIQANPASSA